VSHESHNLVPPHISNEVVPGYQVVLGNDLRLRT
jgi:hypothetical protein